MTDAPLDAPTLADIPRQPTQDGPAVRLYLVDGSGYIFRAYHALPPLTRKSDGLPIGAVAGFSNMLWKYVQDAKGADALALARKNRPRDDEYIALGTQHITPCVLLDLGPGATVVLDVLRHHVGQAEALCHGCRRRHVPRWCHVAT